MPGLYFEEFAEGDTIEHPRGRTISESDNQRFCDLTMNQQRLHLDEEFARGSRFGRRVVNGLYTMSLGVGMALPETTEQTTVANLAYENVIHPEPVFIGDTLTAQTTVTDKRETSDGSQGVVTLTVEVTNQDDTVVCEFDRIALSMKRPE